MPDLVTFLRARLDEDWKVAHKAAFGWGSEWTHEHDAIEEWSVVHADGKRDMVGCEDQDVTGHIARHDPARVLADVAATRELIARVCEPAASVDGEVGCCHDAESLARGWRLQHFTDDGEYDEEGFPEPIPSGCYGVDIVNRVLAPLAVVYAAHPDYREEWKP